MHPELLRQLLRESKISYRNDVELYEAQKVFSLPLSCYLTPEEMEYYSGHSDYWPEADKARLKEIENIVRSRL